MVNDMRYVSMCCLPIIIKQQKWVGSRDTVKSSTLPLVFVPKAVINQNLYTRLGKATHLPGTFNDFCLSEGTDWQGNSTRLMLRDSYFGGLVMLRWKACKPDIEIVEADDSLTWNDDVSMASKNNIGQVINLEFNIFDSMDE
jgi:hypothetical protein